ncbi:UDP-glucuronate 4-epimerase [Parasphingorhabdus marina DSM 22363]|uniref:UDP-glucuronate 4-epimerase n=1 Tax=Parasphingorhabdus marina DSM 22363 TaxID=1123272 RepID=A0A1N6HQ27_9SPHN|nr:SDR family NAD(P)-dependent oxidoreductase [Parasphingorhabdus marina]SIO21816.1 UDP-glucuronate 4-epimerase [Parasphingorhabdus marina DSM 22363]
MRVVLVTGSAGFIGFHLSQVLLAQGCRVIGVDALTDYYDVEIKKARHEILSRHDNFTCHIADITETESFRKIAVEANPDVIVHLAAQAGVRYSIENPRAYIDANVVGTLNVMDCARELEVDHLLMASTSSVYGANSNMPFREDEKTDTPLTMYAATKKANEAMGHSYANLWNLPVTMFRFFTVYGPWGRPDMALFKFTKGILEDTEIDVYNHGNMWRDFTYVEDLVSAISKLIDTPPPDQDNRTSEIAGDSLSPVAPFRIVNIGNSDKVRLLDYIQAIEAETDRKAKMNMLDMQPGDVPATWASSRLLHDLTGFKPTTDYREGVKKFVQWYREYYRM